ncbi:MAG: hypothetical protein A2527_11740 [Candidatus Lambdaproteobacteria bacterium RIFOXYD2_FULL_50_16]|uniref:VCBS repeat-containing protein n=1 Tax=Candidatus Lambdaproteobacteria bacterium RIFOXYD2_FULL_50_16 TaxID=1817772 RepID=A0A1F6G647_9PROT|nr:MAG: hypothetical protein A2527_11740 [Candidatus Lambdaproteobacteria bacterium RIFOXYD2_FULL_50_16]
MRSKFASAVCLFALLIPGSALWAKEVKYNWKQQYYSQLNGERALIFAREMRNAKMAFADVDGDGDEDLFLGQANGQLAYFENQGKPGKPDFVLITQAYKAIFEQRRQVRRVKVWNKIDVGERSAPFLVDIDNDGDFDLFVGTATGAIWHFENIGNNLIPVYKLVTTKFEGINVGRNSVPVFADVNLQRKFDLLVGTVDGKVHLYINQGTRGKPDFRTAKPKAVVEFGLETHASPGLTDWDGDGDLDLIVGMKNGTLSFYENKGDRFFPDWQPIHENFLLIDVGGESAPYFIDIDKDGDDDMIMGSSNPTVSLFENRVQTDRRVLWNIKPNLFNFNKLVVTGSRASVAAGDLDQDGDLDLIVGEKNGNLNYFRNDGTAKEPNWILVTEELLFITGMENSAPELGDVDGDGDLDLLVGDKQGMVAFIENLGTPKVAKWTLKDKTYFQVDVGSNSVPRLLDIDGDGDLDLFMGNFTGRVILYLNKGTKTDPMFALESTRFASAKVSKNSVPTFFDYNKDKYIDLITGADEGSMMLYISPGKAAKDNLNWETSDKAFSNYNVDFLSHPLFTDFNGDGDLDMLIGNDEGDFLLYHNGGASGEGEGMQVVVDNSIDQKSGSLVVEDVDGPIELDIADSTEETASGEEEEFEAFLQEDTPTRQVVEPKFDEIPLLLVRNRNIQKSIPSLGDLDGDGDLDMLVGSKSGAIYYYENQGSDTEYNYQLAKENFIKTTPPFTNSAPVLYDLDQDGDLDLVVGNGLGRLFFYVNQGTTEEANFVLEKDYFRGLYLGKNARPAVADLSGDGILDLLVGTLSGKLTYVRNESNRFLIMRRDYEMIDVGIGSTPSFADLNNDGTLDQLIGSDSGRIYFLKNEKPDLSGKWEFRESATKLEPPKGTAPIAADLDADGDLDLITGTDSGTVLMYRNGAVIKEKEVTEDIQQTPEE